MRAPESEQPGRSQVVSRDCLRCICFVKGHAGHASALIKTAWEGAEAVSEGRAPEGVGLNEQGGHLPGRHQLRAGAGVAQRLPVLLAQVHLQHAHRVVHLRIAACPPLSQPPASTAASSLRLPQRQSRLPKLGSAACQHHSHHKLAALMALWHAYPWKGVRGAEIYTQHQEVRANEQACSAHTVGQTQVKTQCRREGVPPCRTSRMHSLKVNPAPYLLILRKVNSDANHRYPKHRPLSPCSCARALRKSLMHSSEVKPASRGRCRRAYSAWRCATSTPRCAWKRLVTAASRARCSSLSRSAACAWGERCAVSEP